MWIPRKLRVGKVGVKDGLKQISSTGLVLQDLAHLALWVWVEGESKKDVEELSRLVCQLCTLTLGPPTPPTCPPNRSPTPTATMVKGRHSLWLGLCRLAEWPTPPWRHPLAPAQCHSLHLAPPSRAPRGVLGFVV